MSFFFFLGLGFFGNLYRCESTGYDSILEKKLVWISKIKEILGKQSDFLQRKKLVLVIKFLKIN